VADADDKIIALTSPQSGEYINETIFLTSPDYLSAVQFAFRRCDVRSVAVLSDGLQMLALQMPDGNPHAPFFAPLFRFIAKSKDEQAAQEQLVEFLNSPRVQARTDDDITLFLAALITE
jgi:hypothetical protein